MDDSIDPESLPHSPLEDILPMAEIAATDPGHRLELILAAEEWAARDRGYEPSLLPHLARLCHDFSVGELLEIADLFGRGRGIPLVWPQLWESTVVTLATRFEADVFERTVGSRITAAEFAVYRSVGAGQPTPDAGYQVAQLDDPYLAANLDARLLLVEPEGKRLRRVLDQLQPELFDPEASRAILTTAINLEQPLETDWIERALVGEGREDELGRRAHILPALPASDRTDQADFLAGRLSELNLPDYQLAMAISRLGAFVSDPGVWELDSRGWDEPWSPHLEVLATAEPAANLHQDVRRSHVFFFLLDGIAGPHERTAGAVDEMYQRWGGAPMASIDAGPPVDFAPSVDEPAHLPQTVPSQGSSPPQGSEPDLRSLGIDAFAGADELPNALVAGVETAIVVSFGTSARVRLATPANVDFGDADRKRLPAVFVDTSPGTPADHRTERRETMTIRKDPTTSAEVEFAVTPNGTQFSAFVALLAADGESVVQAASITADVVATMAEAAAAERSIRISWAPVTHWSAAKPAETALAAVVHDGTSAIGTGSFPLTTTVDAVIGQIEAITDGIKAMAAKRLAIDDPTLIVPTLVQIARVGHEMRASLRLDRFDDADHIQVVSVSPQSVLPLELVYQAKRAPNQDAMLCPTWAGNGSCTECAKRRRARKQATMVCPSLFWGVSKLVEHHLSEEPIGGDFAVRVLRDATDSPLAAPKSAVLGLSERVLTALQTPIGNVAGVPADAVPGHILGTIDARGDLAAKTVVSTWDEWLDVVEATAPTVLLVMPHQAEETIGNITAPALEIGGTLESSINEDHVRPEGDHPGPLVLLIGCDTGVEHDLLASFGSKFRRYAPVVIATLGEVIAQEAPTVAAAIMQSLAAQADRGGTVGKALQDARRTLLKDARLAGLQLIVHGDTNWTLATDN
ncbi:MAG: hypothetical protein AAGA65_26510 [Actinomycetota bacterium]